MTAAAANPSPVTTGKTTALSVLGAENGTDTGLTYTWSVASGPSGVTFGPNGANAAKNITATFTQAGTYGITVTIADTHSQTITSSVSVTVDQALTTINVTPASITLGENATQPFSAQGLDQFVNAMTVQPTFAWSLGAGSMGSINATTGVFSSGATSGPATIVATANAVTGTATVNVVASTGAQPPFIVTPATATHLTVKGTSVHLFMLGGDADGAHTLTYTWADPPDVHFSANGTYSAKNTIVTFGEAGTYTFTCTIKNKENQTVTSSVTVTVVQTATKININPGSVQLMPGQTQQFTASEVDQFGNAMATQPTFKWCLVKCSAGSIDSNGLYTASSAKNGSMAVVMVSANRINAEADVNVGPHQHGFYDVINHCWRWFRHFDFRSYVRFCFGMRE
jgi:hypothetical protein